MRNTQRKGDYAVARTVGSFTKRGWDVSIPLTESAHYDLIVDAEGELKRVQVKYTSTEAVDLRRVHSNSKGYVIKKSKDNSYDWLYILTAREEEYLIRKCLANRRSIKPTPENAFVG